MKQYARIFNQYKYQMQKRPDDALWPRDGNIGDCIQSLAIENLYRKIGIAVETLTLINRDDIRTYRGGGGTRYVLPMQAWFADYAGVFPLPWSDEIEPVFIGFHLNTIHHTRERFIREKIHEKMKAFEPIGCRDRSTCDFLRSLGVNAYFSGCMTLTFDKREKEPVNGKIFLVDPTRKTLKKLPHWIREQADTSITHFYYWNQYPVTLQGAQDFENEARHILQRYKNEARLVITSKIHAAMPCVAMGIPVIFIHEEADNVRFDVLDGILPRYTPKDMPFIDWNPKAADISELKQALIANALDRLLQKEDKQAIETLNRLTARLKPIKAVSLKKKVTAFMQKLSL